MGFSTLHITATALLVAAVSVPIAAALLTHSWPRVFGCALVAGFTTLGWRLAANVDALNTDGVSWVSGNDVLAGVITYITLDMYTAVSPPLNQTRFRHAQVALAAAALLVNVLAI